ncbi:serine/threonine-protein kinase [Nonomuraea sp. NPDC047897]|uniref:serine/threonine-protein kinase n=1 Tax=Nonomuraea sp. NPDC047897 TaxID=3364346 RepID=UPI003720DD9B
MVAQGTTLAGRYRLDTRIGAGGMGEVWRGEDIVLARTVAVKVLLPGRMDDPGFVARFQAEARAMATINHAGVVDVYDYGVSGDTVYLVMKFVDGEPLDRLLGRLGRIPPKAAMELIAQAAAALQAVHEQGIVHRDVKPGNLMVQRDGTLVLTDFGIARSDLANRLTDAGMVLGTAAYCAPEQAEGAPVTPAVDIYALGVVAYECLVGQRPFDGDSAVTIALKHIREAPPPLPADIPPPVAALVEQALSKDPARRFPSAKAMSETARRLAAGELPPAMPPSTGATMAAPQQQPYPQGQQPGLHQQGGPYQTGAQQSYQTGAQQSYPHQTGAQQHPHHTGAQQHPHQTGAHLAASQDTLVAGQRQGRAAGKARRRGGLVAGIAAAVVLGAGAGAVAVSGMDVLPGPQPTVSTSNLALEPTPDKTTKPPRPRPSKTPTATREQTRPTERSQPPTHEPTSKPTPGKTSTPTPTTSKSPSPTPSVTKQPTKAVPHTLDMLFPEAKKVIEQAGFTVRTDDQTRGAYPAPCLRVGESIPGGGAMLELKKPVKLVLIEAATCPLLSPTPAPTYTASKQ